MNKKQYEQYQKRVAQFFEQEGITNLSILSDENGSCEQYFTWASCDCCGDRLGGNRVDCNGWNPTTKQVCGPYSICTDCEYYAAYGRLDDMTMMEIDKDEN